ncbi:MAG: glycoside hydrolase family 92 protein [Deltaproteobacteria bacterium]|nr:glycoside hydrolase family 92 protein [Deltaproteobacteria bacterium]
MISTVYALRRRQLGISTFGKIAVPTGDKAALTKYYTALYHSLLHPSVYSDVDGEYLGFDNQFHTASGYTQYANYSGWDIYRTQVQLLAWLWPKEASDMAQSLVVAANECGALPKWSQANGETGVMVGDPGALIVANIHAFGGTSFDTAAALKICPDYVAPGSILKFRVQIRIPSRQIGARDFLVSSIADKLETTTGTTEVTVAMSPRCPNLSLVEPDLRASDTIAVQRITGVGGITTSAADIL